MDKDNHESSSKLLECDLQPISETSVLETLVRRFRERQNVGIRKYGATVDREDLNVHDWMQHMQEELMDALMYLGKLQRLMPGVDTIDLLKRSHAAKTEHTEQESKESSHVERGKGNGFTE
jgi:hypothetical protein